MRHYQSASGCTLNGIWKVLFESCLDQTLTLLYKSSDTCTTTPFKKEGLNCTLDTTQRLRFAMAGIDMHYTRKYTWIGLIGMYLHVVFVLQLSGRWEIWKSSSRPNFLGTVVVFNTRSLTFGEHLESSNVDTNVITFGTDRGGWRSICIVNPCTSMQSYWIE